MNTSFNPNDSVVAAKSAQLSTNLGGEYVILGLTDEVYYGLDGVGARIWEFIQQPRKFSEIVDLITTEYDVEREQCEQDVSVLISELSKRSLAQVSPASVT
jgi:hypothetical protein